MSTTESRARYLANPRQCVGCGGVPGCGDAAVLGMSQDVDRRSERRGKVVMAPMPWNVLTSEVARIAPGLLSVALISLALGVVYALSKVVRLYVSVWRYKRRSAQRAKDMRLGLDHLAPALARRRQRLAEGLCVECGTVPHLDGQPWCDTHYQKFGARRDT